MYLNYHVSFIPNLLNEKDLNRLFLAELPNEFSIQRLLKLFYFDRKSIDFFKYNLSENFITRYNTVINQETIKGILLLNFPELTGVIKRINELSDNSTNIFVEEYIHHNVLFRDSVSLINSYYKLLSDKDDNISLIDKLNLDITKESIKEKILNKLRTEQLNSINNFKKVFLELLNNYIVIAKKEENTDSLFMIRLDIIRKYINKYESKLLKVIFSPIKKEDPFCLIVAKTMRDDLSDLIYFFKNNNYPIRIDDICRIIVYLCYHFDSGCLVSYLGKI